MNMFNISFLWMEISSRGWRFSFAHRLVELGFFLAVESKKKTAAAAPGIAKTNH